MPTDLIQSAMYSGEYETEAGEEPYSGRGGHEHALPHGRGHHGMDLDSAAALRIPRGMPKSSYNK